MVDRDVPLAGLSAFVLHDAPLSALNPDFPLASEGIDEGAGFVYVLGGFECDFRRGECLIRQGNEHARGFAAIGVAILRAYLETGMLTTIRNQHSQW